MEGDCRPLQETDGKELRETVDHAWKHGIAIQGDWFRKHAVAVAMAASLGLISTRQDLHTFSKTWRVTSKGMRFLTEARDTE